jgi:hypothetical protein
VGLATAIILDEFGIGATLQELRLQWCNIHAGLFGSMHRLRSVHRLVLGRGCTNLNVAELSSLVTRFHCEGRPLALRLVATLLPSSGAAQLHQVMFWHQLQPQQGAVWSADSRVMIDWLKDWTC